jgi:hypothetical protein
MPQHQSMRITCRRDRVPQQDCCFWLHHAAKFFERSFSEWGTLDNCQIDRAIGQWHRIGPGQDQAWDRSVSATHPGLLAPSVNVPCHQVTPFTPYVDDDSTREQKPLWQREFRRL